MINVRRNISADTLNYVIGPYLHLEAQDGLGDSTDTSCTNEVRLDP